MTKSLLAPEVHVESDLPSSPGSFFITSGGTIRGLLFALATASLPALAVGLPDTGQAACYDGNAMVACNNSNTGDNANYPRQDGRFGRDVATAQGALAKTGGGTAGFDYSKIANNGSVLASTGILGGNPTDWACTRDNVTGLVWEVKTTSGLRSKDYAYSWYSTNTGTNGGNAGTASAGTCLTLGHCDTEKYVADVNAAALCSYTDWRLPSLRELLTLVHLGSANPAIDTNYFPNTQALHFWSASSQSPYFDGAWFVYFASGGTYADYKSVTHYVRLVRGQAF